LRGDPTDINRPGLLSEHRDLMNDKGNRSKLVWMIIATFFVVVGDIVIHFIK
jgi:hypothetical protein